MTAEAPPRPAIREDDPRSLARYLLSFRWEYRDDAIARHLVRGGLPLWRQILKFVPESRSRGRALELGSPPFHITLLIQKLRNYELQLTAYTSDGRPELVQELDSPEYGEHHRFVCTCFDAETERFPFDDDTFDLVIWSEVIEHLTQDPVHTLQEVHRVLKPGGCVVISTPNATRADNVFTLAKGFNIWDPYHLGAVLQGSRHSREYTYRELTELVSGCGFEVDRAEDIDIYPPFTRPIRVFRALMNHGVRRITKGHYRFHLFVRARKGNAPFRPYYPESLFDQGHLAFHLAPFAAKVVMGFNETPHMFAGWSEPRTVGDQTVRRSRDVGDIYVVGRGSEVRTLVANGSGEAQAWHDKPELILLGKTAFEAGGALVEVAIPLNADHDPGKPVHVRFDCPGGVEVASVELA